MKRILTVEEVEAFRKKVDPSFSKELKQFRDDLVIAWSHISDCPDAKNCKKAYKKYKKVCISFIQFLEDNEDSFGTDPKIKRVAVNSL